MIIVQLKGGLGNQLFQYAAGLSLATYHNVPLKVDISELKAPDEEIGTLRHFELQYLVKTPAIAVDKEIKELTDQNPFFKYYQKFLPSFKRKIYNEKKFAYDVNFFKSGPHTYLKGYRQSEKYFLLIRKEIRNILQFKPDVIKNVAEFGLQLKVIDSVSIHIRHGDYMNPALQNYHGIIPLAYYENAIRKITATLQNPVFFVFSDNINWVKKNLQLPSTAIFVSDNISQDHYEDFFLMSQCKHNIIANSSFSWWAAWLNENPGKIVIAPERWFGNAQNNTRDLIPPNWVKL